MHVMRRISDTATFMVDRNDLRLREIIDSINRTIFAGICFRRAIEEMTDPALGEGSTSEGGEGSLTSMSDTGLVDTDGESVESEERDDGTSTFG
jgi:hypothetical protein